MSDVFTEPRVGFTPRPLADFVGQSLPEPRWAVEGIWPEHASGVIAGRPKDKKSTLAIELAVSLNTGTPMFANASFPTIVRRAPVLYVQQENADTRVQRDLQLILAARGLGELREETVAFDEDEVATYQAFEYTPARDGWAEALPRFEVLSHAGFDLSQPDHQSWLEEYVALHSFRYVFLDPLYQLIGTVDEKDSAQLRPVLAFLTYLKNKLGCAAIMTHHMSDKGGKNEAASLLGSTYIHGWYEAAILTRSTESHVVTVKVDAQRDIGVTAQHVLMGLGVGRWMHAPEAEGQTDTLGREAPRVTEKQARKARLRALLAEPESAGWSDERLGQELGVGARTISSYRRELASEES
jgi:hypothetical protein